MKERPLEKTADGSYTLFVPEMDEHYHSVKGARTESEHIFINMGLKQSPAAAPHVLEIGFGTGLNAFLTLLEAETSGRDIRFTTLVLYIFYHRAGSRIKTNCEYSRKILSKTY